MFISVFRHVKDTNVIEKNLPIAEFVRLLTADPELVDGVKGRDDVAAKEAGEMWSPCRYKGDLRNKREAIEVSCLPLDFDKGKDGQAGLPDEDKEELFAWLEKKEYLFVSHTSFTSGYYAPRSKFRVVLFFERPILPTNYNRVWDVLHDQLPVKPDKARRDFSGNFFSPRIPREHVSLYESFCDGHKYIEVETAPDLNTVERPRLDWESELRICENKHETLVKAAFGLGTKSGGDINGVWKTCKIALESNTVSSPVKDWAAAEKTCLTCAEAGWRRAQEEGLEPSDFTPTEKQLAKAAKALRDAVKLVKGDPSQLGNQAYLVGRYTPHVLGATHVVEALATAAAFTNKGAFVDMAQGTLTAQAGVTRGQAAPLFVASKVGWRSRLVVDENGGFAACDANVAAVLQYHPDCLGLLRWNVREDAAVFTRNPPWEYDVETFPTRVRDCDGYPAAAWLAGQKVMGGKPLAARTVLEAMLATAEQDKYDPFADWLGGLKWDGVARLETWLPVFAASEDSPYTRAVGKSFVLGAVARTLDDNAAVDTVLVLVGREGVGKSRTLCTLAGRENFSDELSDIKSKDAHLLMQRCAIVEIAELDKLMQYDSADVKSFVTARRAYIRPAYARSARVVERKAVLAASTNEEHFLKSTTGNRRFYPVTIQGNCDYAGLALAREQIWAEAVSLFRAGEQAWIGDEKILNEAREIQETARVKDVFEDELGFLDGGKPATACTEDARRLTEQGMATFEDQFSPQGKFMWVTLKQVCQHLGIDFMDSRITKRIAKSLRLKGWGPAKQMKVQGKNIQVWPKPL